MSQDVKYNPYLPSPIGSYGFALDKAKTWANQMGREFYVIEYKKGRFDCVGDSVNRKVCLAVRPDQ